ncbi:MAG: tetratricopeptide repeat protein, partial [bacterium]
RLGSEAQVVIHNVPLEADMAARAWLALGEPEKAAAEYRGLIEFDPDTNNRRLRNPIYHYRLGKVYEEMGKSREAAREYERFLAIWHAADPDRPEYIDAHRRLRAITGRDSRASTPR